MRIVTPLLPLAGLTSEPRFPETDILTRAPPSPALANRPASTASKYISSHTRQSRTSLFPTGRGCSHRNRAAPSSTGISTSPPVSLPEIIMRVQVLVVSQTGLTSGSPSTYLRTAHVLRGIAHQWPAVLLHHALSVSRLPHVSSIVSETRSSIA